MNIQHYKLNLDLLKQSSMPVIYGYQLDNKSRYVDITLTANGAEVTLDSTMTAVLNATTNNVIVAEAQSCNISGNVIEVELTDKVLSLPGAVKCEVVLSDSGGTVITAHHFLIKVTEKAINNKSKFEPGGSALATKDDVATAKSEAISAFDALLEDYDESVTMKINLKADRDSVDSALAALTKTVSDNKAEADTALDGKADKATTLEGYGITDAYDKTYITKALKDKLDKMPFDTVLAENSSNYVTSGTVYSAVNALSQTVVKNKSAADTALATKAELIKSKNIFDFDKWAGGLQNLPKPVYNGTLDEVNFEEKSVTFTATGSGSYTNGWTNNPAEMNIAVEPNTVYTFSWKFNGSDSTQMFLFFNGINTAETRLSKSGKTGYITFTTLENTSYITVRFDALSAGTTVTVSDIMIEEGEKSLLYIPYEVAEGVNELTQSTETVLSEVKNTLALKYDSSNVEKGSGTLSPATELNTGNEGSFIYSKNGNTVTVGVNMTKFLAEKSEAKMSGLPFKVDLSVRMSSIIAKTSTGDLCNVRVDGTWLYFTKTGSTFTDSEALTATVTYII